MVADQQGGLRQHQLAKSIKVAVDFTFVPPRQVRHVGNQRYLGIVGSDLRDGADVLGTADKSDLDGSDGHVFERRPSLVCHGLFIEGEVVKDFGGVTHVGAGDDGQRVGACRCNGGDVCSQTARTTRDRWR